MQERRYGAEALRDVSLRGTERLCLDPPDVTGGVLYTRFSIAIELIYRLFQRRPPSFQRTLIDCIRIRYVEMKRGRYFFNTFVAANHQFGIADGDFSVQPASRPGGPE